MMWWGTMDVHPASVRARSFPEQTDQSHMSAAMPVQCCTFRHRRHIDLDVTPINGPYR